MCKLRTMTIKRIRQHLARSERALAQPRRTDGSFAPKPPFTSEELAWFRRPIKGDM